VSRFSTWVRAIVFIEMPQGQVIVVDDGGIPSHPQQLWQKRLDPYDVGVQYLRYRGIHKIDYLIITHGDADHIGELQKVAEPFPVRIVLRIPLRIPPSSPYDHGTEVDADIGGHGRDVAVSPYRSGSSFIRWVDQQ
jgi:competence protein ComEC